MTKKFVFYVTVCLIFSNEIDAQDSSNFTKFNISADIMSRYVWRGNDIGNSASIQPCMEMLFHKFTFGLWGAYTVNAVKMQEIDFYLSYSPIKQLSITFTDYYTFNEQKNSNSFFDFNNNTTKHLFEALTTITPFQKLNISATASVFFFGDDKNADDPEINNYSMYAELKWSPSYKDADFEIFIGGTPFIGYYFDKTGIINSGICIFKDLNLGSMVLPASCSFILNPSTQKTYLVFGITL